MIVIHQLKNRVMLESHKNSMVPNHQPDFYLDPMVAPGLPASPVSSSTLKLPVAWVELVWMIGFEADC